MSINNLPNMKLYWSKDTVFHNAFISSIMSKDRFLQILYNLHLADNSLKPNENLTTTVKFTKLRILLKFYGEIITLAAMVQSTKV